MTAERLQVAALMVTLAGLTLGVHTLTRWRPASALIPVIHGVVMGTVLVLAFLFVRPAFRPHPSIPDLAVAAIWLLIAAATPTVTGTLIDRWRRTLGGRMATWTALLACVGAPSEDGRMLLAGNWHVPAGFAPLWIDSPDHPTGRQLIGAVDKVWVDGEHLMGQGVIRKGVDVTGLMPEVEISPGQVGGDRTVFQAGTVRAVRLGRRPAFNGVWIRVGR